MRGRPAVACLLAAALAVAVVRDAGSSGAGPMLTARTDAIAVGPEDHRLSEWTIASDPTDASHLFIAAMDWDHPTGGIACAGFTSTDAGRSWQPAGAIPGVDAASARIDPWASIGPDGRVHLTCLENVSSADTLLEGEPAAARVLHAEMAGGSWSTSTPVTTRASGGVGGDRPVVLASSSGDLFVCVTTSGLTVTRSQGGGRTWHPVRMESGRMCSSMAEGPDGEIVVSATRWRPLEGAEETLGFYVVAPACVENGVVVSRDGGETWTPYTPAALACSDPVRTTPDEGDLSVRRPAFHAGMLDVNPVDGTVALTNATWTGRRSFEVVASGDGARTFSRLPFEPPSSATCPGCHAVFAFVAFDGDGRLALQYELIADEGVHREVWLVVSADNGAGWSDPFLVASSDGAASDPWMRLPRNTETVTGTAGYYAGRPDAAPGALITAQGLALRPDHFRWGGDYWGLEATTDGFVSSWHEPTAAGGSRIFTRVVGTG